MKYAILYRICLTIACIGLCLTSCQDDEFESVGYYEGDGRIVKVTIPYKVTGQSVQTRVWESQMVEDRVHELRILVFRIEKDNDTETLVGNHMFTEGKGLTSESVATYVPTGTYRIIAISNLSQSVMNTDALDDLVTEVEAQEAGDATKATTFEKFKEKTVRIVNPNPLTRVNSSLVMMGELETQPVTRDGQTLSTIPLRRLDAAVRFTFTPDTDPHEETLNGEQVISQMTSFKLTSWKVCRIPTVTKFYRRADNKNYTTDDITTDPFAERSETYFDNEDTPNQFSFYLLENNLDPKNNPDNYHKREQKKSPQDGGSSEPDVQADNGNSGENTDASGEEKDPDIWKYAHKNSTYVVVTASIDFDITKNGQSYKRHADVTYTIHLGYTTPKAAEKEKQQPNPADFSTLRNTRYYYNVTVKGVNSIIVEALSNDLDGDNFQHGTEGTVIDTDGGENIQVDAHYAAFNIALSPNDIKMMDFEMYSPVDCPEKFTSQTGADIGKAEDEFKSKLACLETYQALRIAEAPGKDELANYSDTYDVVLWEKEDIKDPLVRNAFNTMLATGKKPLYDYFNWKKTVLQEYYNGETPKDGVNVNEQKYWTVFINENVYYGKELNEYIEAADRYWHLHSTKNNDSKDGLSHYAQTRYAISQHSIQTSNDYQNEKEVIGWEQVNEHRYKIIALPPVTQEILDEMGSDISPNDRLLAGWRYTWKNLTHGASGTNIKWEDFLPEGTYETLGEGLYTFKTSQIVAPEGTEGYIVDKNLATWYAQSERAAMTDKACYHAAHAILSRNRDLNRNHTVDKEELRWFLPTDGQYIECAIGGDAMPSPLMRRSEYTGETGDGAVMLLPFRFVGSNYRQLWAEQGFSTGSSFVRDATDRDTNGKIRTGWNLRCARYVSNNISKTPEQLDKEIIDFYEYQEPRIITCKFPTDELRAPVNDFPVFHGNFSRSNWTARKFQYADRVFEYDGWAPENRKDLSSMLWNLNNNYYGVQDASKMERPDAIPEGYKAGPWRVANQRELAILNLSGRLKEVHGWTQQWPYSKPAQVSKGFDASQYVSCTYGELRQGYDIASYKPGAPSPYWCIKAANNNNMAIRPMEEILGAKFCLILVRDILEN